MRWILAASAVLLMGTLPEIVSLNGSIEGAISDDKGPIAAARIEARNQTTGAAYRAISNQSGRYTIEGVRKGRYTLWVVAQGYNPVEIPNLAVETGRATRCDVKLRKTTPMRTAMSRPTHILPLLLQ